MIPQKIIQTLLCVILSFTLFSCEKEEIYNDLEDHWKLEQFTIKENNEVVYCDRLFFGITCLVTEVAQKEAFFNDKVYLARTEYRDDFTKLVLKDFRCQGLTDGMPVEATVEQLRPFGINNREETIFQIVKLTRKNLILESDYARLELTRF